MRRIHHLRIWTGAGVLGGAFVVGASMLAPAASAAPKAPPTARAALAGPVSPVPDSGTPALATTGTTEQVRQLVQCGSTMYAVGTFTQISWRGQTFSRNNIFSFSATAPFTVSSWNPDVNGQVNSIALNSNCTDAYIGGTFSQVGGTTANDIAEISTSTGAVVPGWAHDASAAVYTLLLTPNGHLLVGGNFKTINGSTAHKYYASLSPATGQDDGYLNLNLSGHYVYPGVANNTTSVFSQQLSPDGSYVLDEGVFTKVQGQARQQIFMLNLAANAGNVTGWNSNEFTQHCADRHPLYVKAAAWSPDGNTVYVATTGRHLLNWPGTFPLTGLCDAIAAFPARHTGGLTHKWVNYTGCWSLFAVAASSSTVYAGGHEKYGDNPNGCKNAGPGSHPAPGMGGFNPATGALLLNSAGTAGLYSRSRGLGADDMLVTSAGLWIASDNLQGSDMCGGVSGLAGICFLPNQG